jgi:lipid-binding SYLF domain-containing protein
MSTSASDAAGLASLTILPWQSLLLPPRTCSKKKKIVLRFDVNLHHTLICSIITGNQDMGLNNPLPSSLKSECKKAARILASFVDPKQAFGPDKIIPPEILQNAQGLAVITVLKGGFLFSGRIGSGLLIARLPDGNWSAPSCIGLAGAGVGGQIGLELTDFVMILNTRDAVKTFAALGSVTLGGNVSIAAGPVGRSAEASGSASHRGVSAIFSYSKTKGLFAGISLEGSVLIERRDANKKFYRQSVNAKHILNGSVPPPPGVEPLHRILESRVFAGGRGGNGDDMYNDVPVYGDADSDIWEGRDGEAYGEGRSRRDSTRSNTDTRSGSGKVKGYEDDYDDGYDDLSNRMGSANLNSNRHSTQKLKSQVTGFRSTYSDNPPSRPTSEKPKFKSSEPHYDDEYAPDKTKKFNEYDDLDDNGFVRPQATGSAPSRPPSSTKPKPVMRRGSSLGPNQAIALFTFEADQAGDLGFKKGDIINIVQRSDSTDDWWTGELHGRQGIFPANYVQI